jgi:UPF0755 protein
MLALLMAVVLLGGLVGAGWYGFGRIQAYFMTPDYSGGGTGEVVVEVKAGQSLSEMGTTLVKAGVIKSTAAFVKAADSNSRSTGIQPGFYKLHLQMSGQNALALMLDLKNRMTNQVTIPEGRSAKQIYTLLQQATKIPATQFEAAAKNPAALGVPDWWFTRNDGKKVTPSIEGFLYPDTYQFGPNMTADAILKTMVQNFLTVTGALNFSNQVQTGLGGISPYEALIVASLAQAEAGNKVDLGKIARVAYNRVYKGGFPCNCLQFDSTINYGLELQGKPTKASKALTQSDLTDASNPYNTHVHPGLPPTPINNPGKDALQGAMAPPAGNWLYFVAIDKQGHSAFASTYAEQLRNEQTAKQNGVL